MSTLFRLQTLLAAILFLIVGGCSSQVQEETDLFSSPKSLYVDYMHSHTSGIISSKSAVKVRLSKPVVGGQTTGKHQMAIRPQKGSHQLSLVDEQGRELSLAFEVISEGKAL